MAASGPTDDTLPTPREVYYEIRRVGTYVRVAAIDGDTGIEAVIAGPASVSVQVLRGNAYRKLRYLLGKQQKVKRPGEPRSGWDL